MPSDAPATEKPDTNTDLSEQFYMVATALARLYDAERNLRDCFLVLGDDSAFAPTIRQLDKWGDDLRERWDALAEKVSE